MSDTNFHDKKTDWYQTSKCQNFKFGLGMCTSLAGQHKKQSAKTIYVTIFLFKSIRKNDKWLFYDFIIQYHKFWKFDFSLILVSSQTLWHKLENGSTFFFLNLVTTFYTICISINYCPNSYFWEETKHAKIEAIAMVHTTHASQHIGPL